MLIKASVFPRICAVFALASALVVLPACFASAVELENVDASSVEQTKIPLYTTSSAPLESEAPISETAPKISIAEAKVSGLSNKTYSGKAITQSPVVKLGSETLEAGNDYSVSYKNNKAVGTATVTITGKGSYTDSVKASFKINPATPRVYYKSHREKMGWEKDWKRDGQNSGNMQGVRLESYVILLNTGGLSGTAQYRSHVECIGWQGWRNAGKSSGTTGKCRRIEAIQIKLTGDMSKKYDIYYRTYLQHVGWMGWTKNGARAGSEGFGLRLELMQVKLVPKGKAAPGSTTTPFVSASNAGALSAMQKRFISAANKTPWAGDGYCARWISLVGVRAGLPYATGNACDMWARYCKTSKLGSLKPGMLVAVQRSYSTLGRIYGHIGMYVGNGKVRHNVGAGVRNMMLGTWLDKFNNSKNTAWGYMR